MYLKIALLAFLIFNFDLNAQKYTSNQKDSIKLLYYVDATNNAPFLVPFLETYLKDLSYRGKDQKPVYSEVISLNNLFENREIEGKIIDAFIHADRMKTILENSKERDARDTKIANNLLNFDKFLLIKINTSGSLLEYQFLIYDVIKNNKQPGAKDSPVLKSYRSSSVFIDPKSTNYKEELIFTLKQVCVEVNESPKARIKVNSRIPETPYDTIYLAIKDTVNLDAVAIDPDSPKERLSYSWSANDELLYGQILHGREKQTLVIDTPSVINIGLLIQDGISQSEIVNITLKFIDPPQIRVEAGGIIVSSWEEFDLFKQNINELKDNGGSEEIDDFEYLFRKNLFDKRQLLFGEDSLVIFFTKGKLRLKETSTADSILVSMVEITNFKKDTSIFSFDENGDSTRSDFQKGNYANVKLYPKRKLRVGSYFYSMYADEKGVRSKNIKIRLSFTKVRQISLYNEYAYTFLGWKKGAFGNALLGISWQPFSFMQLSIASSYPFAPSKRIKTQEGDHLEIGNLNSRLTIEFMKANALTLGGFSIHLQQFDVEKPEGTRRKDIVWGVGYRTLTPLLYLGSKINPIISYSYFPNFNKRNYLSKGGAFEFSLGLRYSFLVRKT